MKPLFKVITIISILSIGALSINQYKDYDLYLVKDNPITEPKKEDIVLTSETKYFIRNDIQKPILNTTNDCKYKFYNDDNIVLGRVMGASMNPTLQHDNILICDKTIKDYQNGMIIKFDNGNDSAVHRIKALYPDYLITQGDNNVYEDGRINYSQIDCVVIGVCY